MKKLDEVLGAAEAAEKVHKIIVRSGDLNLVRDKNFDSFFKEITGKIEKLSEISSSYDILKPEEKETLSSSIDELKRIIKRRAISSVSKKFGI